MAEDSTIEWTDATWNIITGCSVVSPGCTNCYAMKLAGTRLKHHPSRAGLTRDSKAGPVWTGEVRFNVEWLKQPLQWKHPRRIFVCAHGDLFAEGVQKRWLDLVFAVMALSPQHTFQILTKRPDRMREYVTSVGLGNIDMLAVGAQLQGFLPCSGPPTIPFADKKAGGQERPWPLPNVWLGTSVEDQRRAEERIPDLLDTPAAVHWISAEPLLGPLELRKIKVADCTYLDAMHGTHSYEAVADTVDEAMRPSGRPLPARRAGLGWVIAGGESGRDARPMHPDWARRIRDDCARSFTPFLFKQWGAWAPVTGSSWRNETVSVMPDGRVREWDAGEGRLIHPQLASLARVGKKRAGRLLDGVEHNDFPVLEAIP